MLPIRPHLLVGLLLVAASARAETVAKQSLLVMPLRAEAELASSAKALDAMVLQAIHDLDQYHVLGQDDLNSLLGVEQIKDAMGCDDVSCAAEIGGALGAPFLVSGSLTALGEQAVLSLQLLDTRVPKVLRRGTARGGTTGDALVQMMAAAVGSCFEVEVSAGPSVKTPAKARPAAAAENYAEYTEVMQALGRRMANSEYTQLLTDLDKYDKQKVNAPAGQDMHEYLTFYRATACFMLKRNQCVAETAKAYIAKWPGGSYATSIQGYVDQIEDATFEAEDGKEQLRARLAEIDALEKKGSLSADQILEMRAYAHFSASSWKSASELFERLLERYQDQADNLMRISQSLCLSQERMGEFEQCRQVLDQAKKRFPKDFRRAGLHHTYRRLPH